MENSDKATPSVIYPMLPKENGEKVVIITPPNGVGKVLIREDTILANLQGCAGCGRGPFACGGVKKQWSALCWGKQLENNYYCLIMVLSTTFVLSFIGTILFCFTNPINDAILSNMVIRNNTLAYSIWQHPNVHPLMKVHIFNYTNWEKVKRGEEKKLHVEELGPYVYSQEMERVNIEFNGDRLSYQERNHFTYLPNKSNGTHFDQVVVPNLPLLGAVSMSKSSDLMSNLLSIYLNGQSSVNFFNAFNPMSLDHPDPFVTLALHRFLWGYKDKLFSAAKTAMQFQRPIPFDDFGLLVTKNGTVSERFTINTGENDKDKMNIIEKVNQEDHLPYWSSAECNSIEASDGSIFPPSQLDRHHSLYVFYPNLCRRLPFIYDKDIELSDGIQLLRYSMPRNVFSHPNNNSRNQCYCEIDTGTCPPEGVINVTACTMGVPAMVSFPHFYLGDEKLRKDITGLDPDGNKHDSYVDLHPTLGIALRGKSSLQINIQVQKTDSFMTLDFLPQGIILPIAWIEMSVEELPESLRSLVYHGTYSTAAVQLGLTVICIISCLASGICLMVVYVRRKRRPCVTLKKVKTLTAPSAPTAETELTVTSTTS